MVTFDFALLRCRGKLISTEGRTVREGLCSYVFVSTDLENDGFHKKLIRQNMIIRILAPRRHLLLFGGP